MSLRKLFFLFLFVPLYIQPRSYIPTFTVMIDPAGDAKNTGRAIQDSLERGITLQYAEELQKELTKRNPYTRIILTRQPGEIIYPLQRASFANRMQVDLYISINFYYETGTKPHLYLYQFSYGDDFITHSAGLALYPYDQAHLFNRKKTITCATQICNTLHQATYEKSFSVHGPYSLPLSPLIGVTAPALGIEMSIKNKKDWYTYVAPIVESIEQIIRGIS